jgi:hypothetical protein
MNERVKILLPLFVFAILLALKMFGGPTFESMSWWTVTMPLWIGPVVICIALVCVIAFSIVMSFFDDGVDR